jgi:NitT/TauT family transport system substrate-binding protein
MSAPRTSTRRRLGLRVAAIMLVGISATALAGCSTDASPGAGSTAGAAEPLAEANLQFGWIPNVESMAPIMASANGYYEDEGTKVTILPGGPEVVADAQIVSGNALMGILSSEALANSVAAGAPLVAVAAMYQTSSSAIVSLASSDITEPKDLEGKRFGMSQTDTRVYTPFFELAGVDMSKVTIVTTGADPASLVSGEVDAMSGTLANQPIAIQAQGYETNQIRLADYGYNRWSGLLVVRKDSLDDPQKRATISGMLTATEKAMTEAVADPDAAAQTVFDVYGEQLGLQLETQKRGAAIWTQLASESTTEQGLMRITEDGIASQQDFFDKIGVAVTASDLFDLSVQDER